MIKLTDRTFTDLMDTLMEVPEVKQHIDSLPVQLGLKLLSQRIELGLTPKQVIKLAEIRKISLSQVQLSRIENGDIEISVKGNLKL
ncbi:helix-turn-helix transcriptional regulator [Salinicoccus kekensis]|uniref:helix-turn-helix transcriptional regulator n=1 Tax=Salinicoccus kekensis TaxID=714307 RepID=UPI00117AD8CC|nr:helix-turn-helix transcriptional regulator [Salinicoccus kekensis]